MASSGASIKPHGQFLPWIEAEFGMSERTAQNFIRVADVYGSKSATVADLDAKALYELAAPSTPEEVREVAAEIDENLLRQKLSPAVEADLISRRKALYEARYPETKKGIAGGLMGGRGRSRVTEIATANLAVANTDPLATSNIEPLAGIDTSDSALMRQSFAEVTHFATGKSVRDIRRASKRGQALGGDALRKIAGTSLPFGQGSP